MIAAAAAMLFCEMMLAPVRGAADNGDWGKLLGRYSVGSGQIFAYAETRFLHGPEYYWHPSGFTSSELLPIRTALALNRLISRDGSMDLRVIGLVQGSLWLLGIVLFVLVSDAPLVSALAVVLFCDFLYAGYLNSFFMDAAALLFTGLSAVFYVRAARRPGVGNSVALFVCMLLAVTAKPQYAILGVWFAILFWASGRVLCRGRKAIAAAASVLLLLAAWVTLREFAPKPYFAKGPFTVVFSRILPHAANPDAALADLGLDDSYRRYIGLTAYSPGNPTEDPVFNRAFLKQASYPRLARFYLTHPADMWKALCAALDESGGFHSPGGNYDSHSGMPPETPYYGLQPFSALKRRLFFHHGGRLFAYYAALIVLVPLLLLWRRKRLPPGTVSGALVLTGIAATLLFVCTLGDVYEQIRHQLVLSAVCDMLLVAVAWLATRRHTPIP